MTWGLVKVEGVIHFENDIEELQQWDHQVFLFLIILSPLSFQSDGDVKYMDDGQLSARVSASIN
jgi:hypothetical protein